MDDSATGGPRLAARPVGVPLEWTGATSSRAYPATRLDQLVERQAAGAPNAVAILGESGAITYADLVAQARILARALCHRGVGPGDIVAVSLERSIRQIVSVLGVLMAGAAYLPIDPAGPIERKRFMLDDARPSAIVTSADAASSIPEAFTHLVVAVDAVQGTPARPESGADVPLPGGTPQDLAYVIYTSGSTGTPKAVPNRHEGVSNHLAWMRETFPLSAGERVLAKTPAVFDVSVWEWFWPLSQGASLVLTRAGDEKDPRALMDAIESHGITNVHFVPTLLRVFLERPDLDRCRSVRRVFSSGEALTPELRDRFFERMPGPPALVNLYGPTEAAVHATGWVCTPGERGPVPIGRPLPNVRAYIVDEHLNPVAAGTQGELLIGGVQVARGYLGRRELTAERFIADPFDDAGRERCYRTGDRVSWRPDGVIDFFGRADAQVQLGGARVELGEIEAALRLHPAVADAAVLVREVGGSPRLYAYGRRADRRQPDPSIDSVRRFLATTLPDYMTPARYVWLDDFPVTPTGKVDRVALAAYEAPRPSIEAPFEAPRPGAESRLARLWCEELQIDRVGRHDGFHLLGGDSLNTVRLFEAIAQEFGVDLPPDQILRTPTIATLAGVMGQVPSQPGATLIVPLRAEGERPPLYLPPSMGGQLLYWRDLVRVLGEGRPVYGLRLPPDGAGPADIRALAAAYVADLLEFQREGPYHLAGYSFSAAVALEMAQQLRALGRRVGVLAIIDYGPGAPEGWSGRLRTAGHFVANLPQWLRYDLLQAGWPAIRGRVRRKMAGARHRLATPGPETPAQLAERAVDEMFDRDRMPGAYRRLTIDQLEAFYRYHPTPYDGRVLLFWARCRPLFHSLSPDLGWGRYANGGFDRVVVRCNHDNILSAPHVQVVAAALDRALNAWPPTPTDEGTAAHRRT
jgi:amino acid adenylation domain-containing protein